MTSKKLGVNQMALNFRSSPFALAFGRRLFQVFLQVSGDIVIPDTEDERETSAGELNQIFLTFSALRNGAGRIAEYF